MSSSRPQPSGGRPSMASSACSDGVDQAGLVAVERLDRERARRARARTRRPGAAPRAARRRRPRARRRSSARCGRPRRRSARRRHRRRRSPPRRRSASGRPASARRSRRRWRTSSRPGGMATRTAAPQPVRLQDLRRARGSQSPTLLDRQFEHVEPPGAHARRQALGERARRSTGEGQIHGLAPRGFMRHATSQALREAGHVLAAAHRVVQRRHVRVEVLVEVVLGDGRLRQLPLLGHLLAVEDLQRRR